MSADLQAQSVNGIEFKVADLSLAEAGRKQIRLAEHEMPGLMALRKEYAGAENTAEPETTEDCEERSDD